MDINEYVKPELLILIPVLYIIGIAIKNTTLILDKYIPLTLGFLGIGLSALYIIATDGLDNLPLVVFTSLTQGFLCAGASVYVNQIVKQASYKE